MLAAAPAHAAEEKKKGGGLSYIQLPATSATLTRGDGRRGVITVEGGVDTPDTALRDKVDKLKPRLRDAWLAVLAAYAAQMPPGTPPDVEFLVQRLQGATDRVVGRPGSRFLIGTVLVN